MNFVIIEQQTANGATAIVTPATYDNEINAEASFLQKCAYARLSGLECHSVSLMNQEGQLIARKCYKAE